MTTKKTAIRQWMGLLPASLTLLLSGLAITPVAAQDYPNHAIRLIVANGPGSGPDLVSRLIEPAMSKFLGQSVVIENRTGAGSIIGYELIKQAPPDGYTIGVVTVPTLASLPVATKNLRFKPLTDLPPVMDLVEGRLALITSPNQPWKSFEEMATYAKANPGKLNYGASTFLVRIIIEAVIRERGLKVMSINYRDQPGMVTATLTSEVAMTILSYGTLLPFGDKVRTIAVTGDQRSPKFPNAPTFKELGIAQIKGTTFSLNVPLGTSKAVIDKLGAAAAYALKQPELVARFTSLGLDIVEPALQTPAAAAKRLADEGKLYAEIAQIAGIQPE